MVSPSINFDYVFVLILFIYVYIFCFLCVCFFSNKSLQFSFSPFILLLCTLILISGILNGQFQDEIEHLHCSWMFAKGLVPFKDFWQHHSPMIWLVLSVFLKKISPTPYIVIISRLFCVVVFFLIGLMGWQIAKTIWNKEARLSTYLLVLLSTAIYTECLVLRPEIFLGLFLLLGI